MSKEEKQEVAVQAPAQLNMSEKFTAKVLQEFGSNIAGAIQVSDYQRQLIQGYFISIDRALKTAEDDRIRKNKNNADHKYDNIVPYIWQNVNLNDLALDVVHYARMGLDMLQSNHLFPIPFKNNKSNQYDITLMPGYNGIQYIAEKYALDPPAAVIVELVYETDTFKPVKKSKDNEVEDYIFEINKPFAGRGDIVGGFGYIKYADQSKNKLIIMSLEDIEKRKPERASANFWGGIATVWENGKKVEKELKGWYAEMCIKTIKREVYSAKNILRDPKKIDDNYQYMKMREAQYAEMEAQAEIDEKANAIVIDTTAPEAPKQIEGPKPATAPVTAKASVPAQGVTEAEQAALPDVPPALAAPAKTKASKKETSDKAAQEGPDF